MVPYSSSSSSSSANPGYQYERATVERVRHTNGATTESASSFRTDGHAAEFEYKSRTTGGSGQALDFNYNPSRCAQDLNSRMGNLRIGNGEPERTGTYKGAVTITREPSRRESISREPSRRESVREPSHREPSKRESNAAHTQRSAAEQERLVINGGVGRSASHREPSRHSAAPPPLAGAGFSQAQAPLRSRSSSHYQAQHGSSSRHESSGHSHRPSSSSHHGSSSSRAHGTPHRASHHPMAEIAEESASHRSSRASPSRAGHTQHVEASGTTRVAERVPTKFER